MNKHYKLIALISILGLVMALVCGFLLMSHTTEHSVCSISAFYGVDCIALNSVFLLSAWNTMIISVKNYIAAFLSVVFILIAADVARLYKRKQVFAQNILLIAKYRIRQAGVFLAVSLSRTLQWLALKSEIIIRVNLSAYNTDKMS